MADYIPKVESQDDKEVKEGHFDRMNEEGKAQTR